ncbi:MAG TPA: hypothetical protein VHY22_13600 [Chthoniobacteraceae bacterium]|jgi:hypothetical protein|nr:hypothetical protein [Chthoniobacteraceae bacterium]
MKKLVFGFLTLATVAATGFAGTETYQATGKESKQAETPTCFSDKEWQVDVFGAYEVGNGPDHAGPIHDHGWGGGVAVNYFFARYFGLSAEGSWLAGHDNAASPEGGAHETEFQSVAGNLIFRYPLDRWCLAPYVFTGGGATMDGSALAVYDVGVGLEYRIVPNKVGIFADGRWNYYGDRYSHDTQNNFMFRTGARWVF